MLPYVKIHQVVKLTRIVHERAAHLQQFVISEVDKPPWMVGVKAAGEAGVGAAKHRCHLVLIARHNYGAVLGQLHFLDNGVQNLSQTRSHSHFDLQQTAFVHKQRFCMTSKIQKTHLGSIRFHAAGLCRTVEQGVRFVDEQSLALRQLQNVFGFLRRAADGFADEIRRGSLLHFMFADHASCAQQLGVQLGHSCFASAGVAHKHSIHKHFSWGPSRFGALFHVPVGPHRIVDCVHGLLNVRHANQSVDFFQNSVNLRNE